MTDRVVINDGAKTHAATNIAALALAIGRIRKLEAALCAMLALNEDMSRFVGQMALQDYALFNAAPIEARAALKP